MNPNVIASGQRKGMPPGRVSITGPFRTVEPVEIRLGTTGPVMSIPGGLDVPAGMTITFAPAEALGGLDVFTGTAITFAPAEAPGGEGS